MTAQKQSLNGTEYTRNCCRQRLIPKERLRTARHFLSVSKNALNIFAKYR